MKIIKPQEGFQHDFLSSPADIVIGGSGAGVGKTFALLLEPLRHYNKDGFYAVIFRRTMEQVRQAGGLWDTSMTLYSGFATPRETTARWFFPSGAKVEFKHLRNYIVKASLLYIIAGLLFLSAILETMILILP